jgi:adenylate kinase family enzyme
MPSILIGETERYYEPYLQRNLDALKGLVADDWDGLIFIFGREGSGKSTFALQLAAYLDPNFSIDKVCWTPGQFKQKVMAANKLDCIVLDEAYLTFANSNLNKEFQTEIISMLTMIRKKNLFILVVSPTFFDLRKYLIIHRALAAIKVYAVNGKRGYWAIYGENSKLKLYVRGRKDNNLDCVSPDVHGKFNKWFPVDKDEYERRKDAAIASLDKKTQSFKQLPPATVEIALINDLIGRGVWSKEQASAYMSQKNLSISAYEQRITRYRRSERDGDGATPYLITSNQELEDESDA